MTKPGEQSLDELIDRITPENQHIPERAPRLGTCDDEGLPHTRDRYKDAPCRNWRESGSVGESPTPATSQMGLCDANIMSKQCPHVRCPECINWHSTGPLPVHPGGEKS